MRSGTSLESATPDRLDVPTNTVCLNGGAVTDFEKRVLVRGGNLLRSPTAGYLTAFTLVCATPDGGTGTVRRFATADSVAVDENS